MVAAISSRARLHDLARLRRSRLPEAGGADSRKASASRRRAVTVTFLSSSSGDVPSARPTRPARAPSGVISWHRPSRRCRLHVEGVRELLDLGVDPLRDLVRELFLLADRVVD